MYLLEIPAYVLHVHAFVRLIYRRTSAYHGTFVYRVGLAVSTDARRGARGTGERPVFPDLDGARVELDRVARRHDLRLEVILQQHDSKKCLR